MSDFAIRVKGLSKMYRLDTAQNDNFKEAVSHSLKSFFKAKKDNGKVNELWALKKISFDLMKGDALGIIGRNGSGKTTLLRILSEVTEPTTGEIEIDGKVASVLEIGMGFHVDLSGRENIYLSGSMFGMNRNEIKSKIDDIIDFSGVEKFMNTPVKHYSSGMHVRLAFSIIAHLSADILLFDEVLSVGDAAFRLKALRRIKKLTQEGKTVIIATHNLAEVSNICNKAIILEEGEIKSIGSPIELISEYTEQVYSVSPQDNGTKPSANKLNQTEEIKNFAVWEDIKTAPGSESAKFHKMVIKAKGKKASDAIYVDDVVETEFYFWKTDKEKMIDVTYVLKDGADYSIFTSGTILCDPWDETKSNGLYKVRGEIPSNFLNPGFFILDVFLLENRKDIIVKLPYAISFKVWLPETKTGSFEEKLTSPLRLSTHWDSEKLEDQ